jgi:hypothetical protein
VSEAADRFETVAWIYSQSELAVFLSLFEHEDIWIVPVGRGHISVQWNWTVALGGVAIRVHAADAAAARALLAGIDRSPWRGGVFSDNRLLDIVLILLLIAVGLFAPPARIPAEFVRERFSRVSNP